MIDRELVSSDIDFVERKLSCRVVKIGKTKNDGVIMRTIPLGPEIYINQLKVVEDYFSGQMFLLVNDDNSLTIVIERPFK